MADIRFATLGVLNYMSAKRCIQERLDPLGPVFFCNYYGAILLLLSNNYKQVSCRAAYFDEKFIIY